MTTNRRLADRDDGAPVAVSIRIDKKDALRLQEIVKDLKGLGLGDIDTHERLLMVNGTCDTSLMDDLRKVKGVTSVREDRVYRTLDKTRD